MAKRKSKRKIPTGKKLIQPLDTIFTCPFCNHENSCEVSINRQSKVAQIVCSICNEDYRTKTTVLTEPIDVYNEWIDACEEANKN